MVFQNLKSDVNEEKLGRKFTFFVLINWRCKKDIFFKNNVDSKLIMYFRLKEKELIIKVVYPSRKVRQ